MKKFVEAYYTLTAQASAECKSTFLEDYGATFLELLQREIEKLKRLSITSLPKGA